MPGNVLDRRRALSAPGLALWIADQAAWRSGSSALRGGVSLFDGVRHGRPLRYSPVALNAGSPNH